MNDIYETANLHDVLNGYVCDAEKGTYSCIFCGAVFERGIIYPVDEILADAERAAKLHIAHTHGSVFEMLLTGDKRENGLTATQKALLASFYEGKSDKEISAETGTAQATVRYQRFAFREKARQAKSVLAMSILLERRLESLPAAQSARLPEIHRGAKMVDERYIVMDEEADKIIGTFFYSRSPLKLRQFSAKAKNKLVTLRLIASQFDAEREYTEGEVNGILREIFSDFVTIRRYLIEYGFLDRTRDGSKYWVK